MQEKKRYLRNDIHYKKRKKRRISADRRMNYEDRIDSEEEILVYAECVDSVDIEKYRSIHVLGINSKNPIIQMDETIFAGQLKRPTGTHMFFMKDHTPISEDPLFDKLPNESVKYVCKASKYLNLKHAYITSKDDPEQSLPTQVGQTENDLVPMSFSTVEEAVEMFHSEWESKIHETILDLIGDGVQV